MKLPEKGVDLAKLIGKSRERIYLVGVELEGGWASLPKGVRLQHDGSVQGLVPDAVERVIRAGSDWPKDYKGPRFIGELPSQPLGIKEWAEWVTAYYPSHVNATCGLHVHMSFSYPLNYQRLMDPRYPRTVIERTQEWAEEQRLPKDHPIWKRLLGQNEYCQHAYFADAQAKQHRKGHHREGEGHRYTVINYPYGLHQTAECRLLPMFEEPKQAISAIQNLLDTTNAFLLACAKRESGIKVGVKEQGEFHKEIRQCV